MSKTKDSAFEWTPFMRGFVFWEMPTAEHLPPAADDIEDLREWLHGFEQAHADSPEDPRSWTDPSLGESVPKALDRLLAGHPALPTLKMLLRPV